MSSPQQNVSNNSRYDSQKAAAKAILDAITAQVDAVTAEGGGPDHIGPRLKRLAETYALVVHGKSD
ncbi:hypothetical protein [Streptomyces spiralis]|uniref:hypothetical protein n=1 Tax=Streptomyces spiralis TaxID=66376 RepID=UPI00368804A9